MCKNKKYDHVDSMIRQVNHRLPSFPLPSWLVQLGIETPKYLVLLW